eukprot:GFUD01006776.1.p1 GENE.GFUD01006776.1~~GFUD01006776.1.p1  ORF type:complete len:328 (+),score=99.51 GFUD01006776.1:103-984(+)
MDLVMLVTFSPLLHSLVTSLGVPLSWLGRLEIFLPEFEQSTVSELDRIFTRGDTLHMESKEVGKLNSLIGALGLKIDSLIEIVGEDSLKSDVEAMDLENYTSFDDSTEINTSESDISIEHDDDMMDMNKNPQNGATNTQTGSSSKVTVKQDSQLFGPHRLEMNGRLQKQPPPVIINSPTHLTAPTHQPPCLHTTPDHNQGTMQECKVNLKKLSYPIIINSIHNHSGLRSNACKKCSNCVSNTVVGSCGKCRFCVDLALPAGLRKWKQKCESKKKCLAPRYSACYHCVQLHSNQ